MRNTSYCDLCGNEVQVTAVLSDIKDNEMKVVQSFQIVECEKCSHCFLHPFPKSFDEVSKCYPDNYYAHSACTVRKKNIKNGIKRLLRKAYYKKNTHHLFLHRILFCFFAKTVNEPPIIRDGKLCDIGCGKGEYIYEAQSYGWEVYGVEPNEKSIDYCLSKGLNVKHGYAEQIPYDDSTFNVVRMWSVLEHTISPRKALLECNRILKSDGYLLLYVPNFGSLDSRMFGKWWGSLEVPRHIHHFKYNTLELYLEKTGFKVEKVLYPGTLVSGIKKTVNIMKKDGVSITDILTRVIKCISVKLYYRMFRGSCLFDVGIAVLAKKPE